MTPTSYDEDQNPAGLVLGTHDTIHSYVHSVKAVKKWSQMSDVQRANHLAQAAGEQLRRLGIPEPLGTGWITGLNADGVFYHKLWQIRFPRSTMAGGSKMDMARQASAMLHEFEHLATYYVAAQYLAATKVPDIAKKLGIPPQIALHADRHPLPSGNRGAMRLGRECVRRVTADKDPVSPGERGYYAVLRSRLNASGASAKAAEQSFEAAQRKLPEGKAEFYAAADKMRQKQREYHSTHKEYRASSVEVGSTLVENLVRRALLN